MTRPPNARYRRHAGALLLAQATVAAGVLLITLGVTIHLGAPWSAGWSLGLFAAWGILSVPLAELARDGRSSDAA